MEEQGHVVVEQEAEEGSIEAAESHGIQRKVGGICKVHKILVN